MVLPITTWTAVASVVCGTTDMMMTHYYK